jgi:hypothetical protein
MREGRVFGAAVTTVALAAVLVTGSAWLPAWQTPALAAAFLNAVFGYCLECEMYLLARRMTVGVK